MRQATQTLRRLRSPLAHTRYQLKVLHQPVETHSLPSFADTLRQHGKYPLKRAKLEILQLNLGKLCNQTCRHCHVDAGPDRKDEVMSKDILQRALELIRMHRIPTVDLTGGAPEMNPHFRWFVEQCSSLGSHIIDRCNLTILTAGAQYRDLPQFFARHGVHIVSSLPHYSKNRTDAQRGEGVFEASIEALRMLNDVGYGQPDSALQLDLVFNPTGAFLPSQQCTLERVYKDKLLRKYGIRFNRLIVITNMPINRFLDYLLQTNQYHQYMQTLVDAFNPATIDGLMCRNTLSVSWDGYLYDCDFNQMLDLKIRHNSPHIFDINIESLEGLPITLHQACYGCTAGAGSSCSGEIAS